MADIRSTNCYFHFTYIQLKAQPIIMSETSSKYSTQDFMTVEGRERVTERTAEIFEETSNIASSKIDRNVNFSAMEIKQLHQLRVSRIAIYKSAFGYEASYPKRDLIYMAIALECEDKPSVNTVEFCKAYRVSRSIFCQSIARLQTRRLIDFWQQENRRGFHFSFKYRGE